MTLTTFLDRAYAARFQIKRPGADAPEYTPDVLGAFRAAAAEDPTLITAARAEFARLTPDIEKRCIVSRMHKSFLRAALGDTA